MDRPRGGILSQARSDVPSQAGTLHRDADVHLILRVLDEVHDRVDDVFRLVDQWHPQLMSGVVRGMLPEWRRGRPRIDDADMDGIVFAVLLQLLANRRAQELHAALGCAVDPVVRHRDLPRDRRDVDQGSPTTFPEMLHRQVAAVQHPDQVRLHDPDLVLERDLREGSDGANPGVVDPDVDVPELRDRAVMDVPHIVDARDIGRDRDRMLDLLGQLSDQVFPPGGQHQVVLLPRKDLSHALAKTAGGAGDDDGPGHGVLLACPKKSMSGHTASGGP